ncbi:MAG: hypothetical protein AAF458_01500 [Pseudomonadota bacterium]
MTDQPDVMPAARHDEDGPVFESSWHAQALATANVLIDAGVLDRDAWSQALGAALRRRPEPPGDAQNFYYECVIEALEALLAQSGQIVQPEVDAREHAWRNAYHRTPHGAPVELRPEDLSREDGN